MSDFRRLVRVLAAPMLAAVALTACQEPPRPFLSLDPVREQPLSVPSAPSSVIVRAVTGAPRPVALAEAMAEAMTRRDVAATTGPGNLTTWLLTGQATGRDAPGGMVDLRIHWDLADAKGGARGAFDQRSRVAGAAWAQGEPALLKQLTEAAAAALAPRLADQNVPDLKRRTLTVYAVDGAPGDGGISLRRALAYALGKHGFRLSDEIAADGIVLTGTVRVVPHERLGDDVTITWTALAPDGAVLGNVEQRNQVPAGSLSGTWGVAAVAVADAAVPGIARLLARADVAAAGNRGKAP